MNYSIKFEKVEKTLIKFDKRFKNNKIGCSLYEAEVLLNEAKEYFQSILEINFTLVNNSDDQYAYEFAAAIHSEDQNFSLMDFLEEEVSSSGLEEEEAQKLISSLYKDYNQEKKSYEEDYHKDNEVNSSNDKKNGTLFSRFFKKNSESVEPVQELETTSFADEFQELENPVIDLEKENLSEVEYNEIYLEESYQAPEEIIYEPSEKDLENKKEKNIIISNNEEDNLGVEQVNFPFKGEYLNIDEVQQHAKTFLVKLSIKAFLMKLGLENPSNELQVKQSEFVVQTLKQSDLVDLREFYEKETKEIERSLINALRQSHDQVLLKDYTKIADEELENEYLEMDAALNEKFTVLKHERAIKLDAEIYEFDNQQKIEREIFLENQKNKRDNFIEHMNSKNETELKREEEQVLLNFEKIKNDAQSKKSVEIQRISVAELNRIKESAIDEGINSLEQIMNQVSANIEEMLHEVKLTLDEKESFFLQRIDIEEQKASEKRKEERHLKELELKEKELALLEENKLQNGNKQVVKTEEIQDVVENLVKIENQKNMEKVSIPLEKELVPNSQTSIKNEESKTFLKMGIGGLLVGALLIGGGTLIGSSLSGEDIDNKNITDTEALAKGVEDIKYESLIQELKRSSLLEEKETLEELLLKEDYDVALQKYTDKKSLNQIENEFYNKEKIQDLIDLNKKFITDYGKVDVAILQGDADQAYAAYNKLTKNLKKDFSTTKRNNLAALLFKEGKNKEANKIIQ